MIPASTVLEIDLELVRFKSVLDVMGDMKVVKKVLKEGEGHRRPKDGESVSGKLLLKKSTQGSLMELY